MSLHAAVIGIDGSGKSSVSRGVAEHLAREQRIVTAHAGDSFELFVGHDGPFREIADGLPPSAAIARQLRRAAKATTSLRFLYPPLKLAQMAFQDSAAYRMERGRHRPAWILSDGNLLLNASGRGSNYRRAASRGEASSHVPPSIDDIAAMFGHLCDGSPLPRASRERLPPLRSAHALLSALRALGLRPAWLPDVVLFLDVPPAIALDRIRARGESIDAHENVADLEQAREGYLRALAAFERHRARPCVITLDAGALSRDAILLAATDALDAWLRET